MRLALELSQRFEDLERRAARWDSKALEHVIAA
jgi:hypothetical protein